MPTAATLQMAIPAGRAALAAKPFVAPAPAFKPRAAGGDAGDMPSPNLSGLQGLSLADDSDDDEPAVDYFGQGMYY